MVLFLFSLHIVIRHIKNMVPCRFYHVFLILYVYYEYHRKSNSHFT